jgi:hypothetical protein
VADLLPLRPAPYADLVTSPEAQAEVNRLIVEGKVIVTDRHVYATGHVAELIHERDRFLAALRGSFSESGWCALCDTHGSKRCPVCGPEVAHG